MAKVESNSFPSLEAQLIDLSLPLMRNIEAPKFDWLSRWRRLVSFFIILIPP
jgi:hypothetical protein